MKHTILILSEESHTHRYECIKNSILQSCFDGVTRMELCASGVFSIKICLVLFDIREMGGPVRDIAGTHALQAKIPIWLGQEIDEISRIEGRYGLS